MKELMDQKQYKKKQKIELSIVFQTKEDIFDLKVRMQEQTRRLLKISNRKQVSIFHQSGVEVMILQRVQKRGMHPPLWFIMPTGNHQKQRRPCHHLG
jgi:hypothetical protein